MKIAGTILAVAIAITLVAGGKIWGNAQQRKYDMEQFMLMKEQIDSQQTVIDSLQADLRVFKQYLEPEIERVEGVVRGAGVPEAEVQEIARYMIAYSIKRHIPIRVTVAVGFQESRFRRFARSEAGALGIMQVMPSLWGRTFENECGYWYRGDVKTNICIGVHILAQNLQLHGDLGDALSAYYCGQPLAKSRHGQWYYNQIDQRLRTLFAT